MNKVKIRYIRNRSLVVIRQNRSKMGKEDEKQMMYININGVACNY